MPKCELPINFLLCHQSHHYTVIQKTCKPSILFFHGISIDTVLTRKRLDQLSRLHSKNQLPTALGPTGLGNHIPKLPSKSHAFFMPNLWLLSYPSMDLPTEV
jgi:hypothetical protein